MTNHSDNNDSSTETSTNGKNPKKTLAKARRHSRR